MVISKDKYSCTSNTIKLLKHLDTLKNIQNGIYVPIMIHIIPTHRCQLNCLHCCFKNRKGKEADMDLEVFKKGIISFYNLGTRAIEFTGGGEPSLYPAINEAVDYSYGLGLNIGFITNGIKPVDTVDRMNWVRISLNTLDYLGELDISKFKRSKAKVTACYIWNDLSDKNIEKIIDYANKEEVVCRVAPDCIKPVSEIENDILHIRNVLSEFKDNRYVFLSDFNIETKRRNNKCFIPMIKPGFYLDGYVYACPSAELALENNKQIPKKFRICRYDEIYDYYTKHFSVLNYNCSYCKYVKQQELLEDLLEETSFNEFA